MERQAATRPRDTVALGAAAAGVEALLSLVGGLPGDLPAALFVVLHFPIDAQSALSALLDRAGSRASTACGSNRPASTSPHPTTT